MSGDPIGVAALRRRWLMLAVVVSVLALPLTIAARGPEVLPGDADVMHAIQARPSAALDSVALAFTAIGGAWPGVPLITAAAVVLLVVRGARRTAVFIAAAALASSINVLTKRIVASPRPTVDLAHVIQVANGTGFPSGHAFSATLLYGAFWIVLPTIVPNQIACRLLRWVTVFIWFGICWSRMRLGAHWPSDVLGGILWGIVALSLLAALFLPGILRDKLASPPPMP